MIHNNNRLLNKLIAFTSVPIILISVYVCFFTYQKNKNELLSTIEVRLSETKSLIDGHIVKYIDKSSYIVTNQYLIHNIQKNYGNDLEQMIYFLENTDAMISEPYYEYIKSPFLIYAYNETLYNGKFVNRISGLARDEVIEVAMDAPPADIVWRPGLTEKNEQFYMTFYRNIVDFKTSVGILEVNIPYRDIVSAMDAIGVPDRGLIFSVSEAGDLLHINNRTSLEISDPGAVGRNAYFMASDTLKDGNKLTIAIPKREAYQKTIRTFAAVFVFFGVYVLVMLLASKLTAQKITGTLESYINKIKRNDQLLLNDELIQVKGNDDVSAVKLKLKELVSRINEIHQEMAAVKLEKSALEIELLQSRINPHLLYNSLSVINWTALWNKDHKTVEIIDAMTKYYRIALSKGNSLISVASELEMIQQYVKINVMAHSVDYRLDLEIENNILNYYTSKHLIQPIVENAILHGLNGKRAEAIVTIKGYLDAADIVFEISDNGRGMEQATVDGILSLNYSGSYGGYGIKNVIRRIQLYYGAGYGVAMESEPGKGTKVTIRIEALTEAELNERKEFRKPDISRF